MAITRAIRHGIAAALLCLPAVAAQADTAFPGAQGYGAGAVGWRGGALIPVTNLDDRGEGSLRACAEAEGPRICISRVSGTILLSEPIMARSDLYIAGQTAPGDGIQLRMDNPMAGPLIVKNASDVVVRFIKLRPGAGQRETANIDALTLENVSRVYIGNMSMMFASDETFNVHVSNSTAEDITLADSILAYSLDRSVHPKGRHSKGALICSDEGPVNECGRISLLRNIFAHHRDRNPDIKATSIGPVEVVNNIFYNPISQMGEFYDLLGETRIAYVGNVALKGPSSTRRVPAAVELFDWTAGNQIRIWAQDNIAGRCGDPGSMPVLDPVARMLQTDGPIPLTVTPMAAGDLLQALPQSAGDLLPGGAHRDRLDQQVLDSLSDCRGRVINRPRQVGGWAELPEAAPPADSDGDLLPDAWEEAQPDLDPQRTDDPWQDSDGDGLAAVETWLATRAGDL